MAEQLIEKKLESLRRCVGRVQERIPETSEALAGDPDSQDIGALNLTRAIQLCVDIASHWAKRHPGLPAPQSMGGAFELLARAGVIDPALATQLRHSVGSATSWSMPTKKWTGASSTPSEQDTSTNSESSPAISQTRRA